VRGLARTALQLNRESQTQGGASQQEGGRLGAVGAEEAHERVLSCSVSWAATPWTVDRCPQRPEGRLVRRVSQSPAGGASAGGADEREARVQAATSHWSGRV
jgi:hypothetical protein